MPVIDFQTKELLAKARLEPFAAARLCGLTPAKVSLCVRGIKPWHPDERGFFHEFLKGKIDDEREQVAAEK